MELYVLTAADSCRMRTYETNLCARVYIIMTINREIHWSKITTFVFNHASTKKRFVTIKMYLKLFSSIKNVT